MLLASVVIQIPTAQNNGFRISANSSSRDFGWIILGFVIARDILSHLSILRSPTKSLLLQHSFVSAVCGIEVGGDGIGPEIGDGTWFDPCLRG